MARHTPTLPKIHVLAPLLVIFLVACDRSGPTTVDEDIDPQEGPAATISAPATGANVQVGTPLAFDGSQSQDPAGGGLVYSWAFGDGGLGGGAGIAHAYANAGSYTAVLTVTDVDGRSDTADIEVVVEAAPPPASTDGILHGLVMDGEGSPLEGVTVTMMGGPILATTDHEGRVEITGFPTGVERALGLSRPDYSQDVVVVRVDSEVGEGYFQGGLRARNAAIELPDAAAGGTVVGEDGAAITLPPNALVDAAGNPVSGAVQVTITPLNVSGPELGAFPGEFQGILPDASTTAIVSLGATEYVLSQGGEELQLASGETATLLLPIYTTGASVGDPIPLWSLDESTGVWVREGVGAVVSEGSGLALEAEVSHLSWWNVDLETEVMKVFFDCEGLVPLVFTGCFLSAETQGDGPRWGESALLSSAGDTLPLPVATTVALDALVFADGCVARGTATVEVPASGPLDDVSIVVDCLDGTTATRLEYGDRLDGVLEAGETDRYVWAGTEGDEVRVDLEPVFAPDAVYQIRDPDGVSIAGGNLNGGQHLFLTLAASGDHEIDVLADTSASGNYVVGLERHVAEPPQAITLPADIEGSIGFPASLETDVFTLDGAAGDEISYAITTEARAGFQLLAGDIRVISPTDQVLADEFFGFGSSAAVVAGRGLRLPETGTYRIEVTGDANFPGPYVLEVRASPSTALVDGSSVSTGINRLLEVDPYRFDVPGGETVRIDLDAPDSPLGEDQIRVTVHDPSGIELVDASGQQAQGLNHWFVETPAGGGESRIAVHGLFPTSVPDYELAFEVFTPEPSTALVDGDEVVGEIGFPAEVDVYTFEGEAGDEPTITVAAAEAETGPFRGTVVLKDPSGGTLRTGEFNETGAFGETTTLPATGTYTVEVAGDDGVPFQYEISLDSAPPPGPGALTVGDLVDGSIDVLGGVDEYTFEGTAGQAVRIHAVAAAFSDLDGWVRVIPPSSAVPIMEDRLRSGSSRNRVLDLTETGTYTLEVQASFATGAYRLGLGNDIGRRDPGFGTSGQARGPSGGGEFVQVEPLSGGTTLAFSPEMLVRFDASGAQDVVFGSGGEVDLNEVIGGTAGAMHLLPDGSIVVASAVNTSTFNGWRVAKFTAAGALDPGFGSGGITETVLPQTVSLLDDVPETILAIADGAGSDLLVVGKSRETSATAIRTITMFRLNPDGSPDPSFGGGANPLVTSIGLNVAGAVLQSDGRIVVAGGGGGTARAYRFAPDGTQDTGFGVGGEASVSYAATGGIENLAVRPDDRLVLVGQGILDMAVVQLTAAGAADASFGTGGVVLVDHGHRERAFGVTIGLSGELYVAGYMLVEGSNSANDGMLVRLLTDGSLDPAFAVRGRLHEATPERLYSPALDSSGRLIVGSESTRSTDTGSILRLLLN